MKKKRKKKDKPMAPSWSMERRKMLMEKTEETRESTSPCPHDMMRIRA
jgi:hypothetical protein